MLVYSLLILSQNMWNDAFTVNVLIVQFHMPKLGIIISNPHSHTILDKEFTRKKCHFTRCIILRHVIICDKNTIMYNYKYS